MKNNGYAIELATDDGKGFAKFWRYYDYSVRAFSKYGVSTWTGIIEIIKDGEKHVERKGFATKADVLKFLQLRPEFQTQLQKLTQKKI